MECSWIVNRMAILRGGKRSEKTRVERPYLHQNFDMAIYSGEHNREGAGGWEDGRQKTPLLLLPLQAIAKKPQQSRGRR